jgi:sterol desaturase/sphingolipid hydroxylase (fatty acid hydroxylase superfamily)
MWGKMETAGGAAADPTIRLAFFALLFILLAALEHVFTARPQMGDNDRRAVTNFGFGICNALLGAAIPVGAVYAATLAGAHGIGLFRLVPVPVWAIFPIYLLARSLVAYAFHRASHRLAWLWRIHRVHHSDRFVDLSTAFRNHPFELICALVLAALTTGALGAPLPIVVVAELTLFAPALWTHANFSLPPALERGAGWLVVTPAVHLRHHSSLKPECDSNYGELLVLWDRLFGSYGPAAPVERLGLGDIEDEAADDLVRQVVRPFRP